MSKAENRAKTKWNAKNYAQIKVYADPDVAAAFKSACQEASLSMASVLTQFMTQFSGFKKSAVPYDVDMIDVSTRGKRRKIVFSMKKTLAKVRDAEENYMFSIPENLQGSNRYDAAEQSVSAMDEVIVLLDEVY